MRTSPPSLSITCIAMDNVRKILKNRRLSVNGLLTLIHSKHPDCGLPYSILRRLISYERKMTIDETILICDALDVPFTALFSFAGEFPHGQLKGMTAADIYHAIEQDDPVQLVISKCKNLRYAYRIAFQVLLDGLRGITDNYPSLEDLRITNPETLRSVFCIEAMLHAAALSDSDIRTCRAWASDPSYASTVADVIRKAGSRYPEEERKQVEDILMFLESKDAAETWHTIGHRMPDIFVMPGSSASFHGKDAFQSIH